MERRDRPEGLAFDGNIRKPRRRGASSSTTLMRVRGSTHGVRRFGWSIDRCTVHKHPQPSDRLAPKHMEALFREGVCPQVAAEMQGRSAEAGDPSVAPVSFIGTGTGWNTDRAAVSRNSADLCNGAKSRCAKLDPGVFFALFGAYVLVSGLENALYIPGASPGVRQKERGEMTNAQPNQGGGLHYAGGNSEELWLATARSINTLGLLDVTSVKTLSHRAAIDDARMQLYEFRDRFVVRKKFSTEELQIYDRHMKNPDLVSTDENERKILEAVRLWMEGDLIDDP